MLNYFAFSSCFASTNYEFPVVQSNYATGYIEPEHTHDFFELVVAQRGRGLYHFGEREF